MKEISPMIKAYFDAFDMYEIKSPALKTKVDIFKEKLISFSDSHPDMMTFFDEFNKAGLMEEYTSLISGVAMAAQTSNVEEEKNDIKIPTVKEFLEQYRVAYNEVKKAGDRPLAEATYLKLFDVANRTDDMIEAQTIIEKERLLWNIASMDSINIFLNTLKKLDPLYRATSVVTRNTLIAYMNATCDEELSYYIDLNDSKNLAEINDFVTRMYLAASIATDLLEYTKGRIDVYEWLTDDLAYRGVKAMEANRVSIRNKIDILKRDYNLTIDDLLNDEGVAVFMLSPSNIDEFGRRKLSMHNRNYEVYKSLIYDEILTDRSLEDILLYPVEKAIWFKE